MEQLRQVPLPSLTFDTPTPWLVDLEVDVCDTFWSRLMGVRQDGRAFLFPGTRGLHGFGMKESIWVVWFDKDQRVVATHWLHPGRFVFRPEGAVDALEVTMDGIEEALCEQLH
jgi:hypothetical protein